MKPVISVAGLTAATAANSPWTAPDVALEGGQHHDS